MDTIFSKHTVFVTCLLWAVCSSVAAEIHRYKDESGKWHFTDNAAEIESNDAERVDFDSALNISSSQANPKAPVVLVPHNICKADAARRPLIDHVSGGYLGKKASVELMKSGPDNNPSFHVQNDYFAPITFSFALKERQNITPSRPVPLRIEVPPQSKAKVLELAPSNPDNSWRYRYSYNFKVGTLNPRHDSSCYYLPPVPAGSAFRVTQAFNGSFSHNNSHSRFAVDIAMPIGTDVVAARGGIIIDRDTEYALSGLSEKFLSRANAIRILHADGTIAVYAHLQFRSMKFYEGEVVQAGQVIGRSGNTGYSTGPHLHFAIHANQNMKINSVPFKFFIDGKPVLPQRGMILESDPIL